MKLMLQIGLVFGICFLGQLVEAVLPIPVPGSVLSLIFLLILLILKIVKVDHVRQKSDFLLKNMAFFFVPAGVGVMAYFRILREDWFPFVVVVVVTTFLTFGAAALSSALVLKWQRRLRRARRRP